MGISIGTASLDRYTESEEDVLAAADKDMYRDKFPVADNPLHQPTSRCERLAGQGPTCRRLTAVVRDLAVEAGAVACPRDAGADVEQLVPNPFARLTDRRRRRAPQRPHR